MERQNILRWVCQEYWEIILLKRDEMKEKLASLWQETTRRTDRIREYNRAVGGVIGF